MQHRIRTTTVAAVCGATIAAHGAMYGVFRRDVAGIVREQVRAEIEPLRGDVARAHDRLDQHLAVRQP